MACLSQGTLFSPSPPYTYTPFHTLSTNRLIRILDLLVCLRMHEMTPGIYVRFVAVLFRELGSMSVSGSTASSLESPLRFTNAKVLARSVVDCRWSLQELIRILYVDKANMNSKYILREWNSLFSYHQVRNLCNRIRTWDMQLSTLPHQVWIENVHVAGVANCKASLS